MNKLRSYQQEDVNKLLKLPAMGLFNQQRTGKTPTALSVMKERGINKLLIVCPTSAIFQWVKEAKTWFSQTAIACIGTKLTKEKIVDDWNTGALVIGYDSLKETANRSGLITKILKQNPEGMIVDEAHRIKETNSNNFKAIKRCASKIKYRLLLTGTPAPNKPHEIFALLHIIDNKTFSSKWRFYEEFFYVRDMSFSGRIIKDVGSIRPEKRKELQQLLNKYCVRRLRKDVMLWLPEKDIRYIQIPATQKQLKHIKELEDFFETDNIVTKAVLDRLIRYRQLCLDPKILNLEEKSPKTDWVLTYLKDYPEKQIIIFSKFTTYIDILYKILKEKKALVEKITGKVSIKKRNEIVTAFQNHNIKILILQIDACKEALTLDAAETIIFTDIYPPIADIEQAEDRFVATKKDYANKEHTVYKLILEGTYDEAIRDLVESRASEIDAVNNYIKYLKEVKT